MKTKFKNTVIAAAFCLLATLIALVEHFTALDGTW